MKTKQVNNKTTKKAVERLPVLFNYDGLKKVVLEFVESLDNQVKDESYSTNRATATWVMDAFLKYISPEQAGLLSIYSIYMDGKSSAVVIAFSADHAQELLKADHKLNKVKRIDVLGEASKGQDEGIVTYDPGVYV